MAIMIMIEIKARELDSAILLALEGAINDIKVIICPHSLVNDSLIKSKFKFIYHDKSISNGKDEYFKKLKKNGISITSIDQEHGLLQTDFNMFLEARYPEKSLALVDKVFTWGNYDHQKILDYHPTLSSKVKCTGSPRIDIWRNINFSTSQLKKQILVSSNLGGIMDFKRIWQLKQALDDYILTNQSFETDMYDSQIQSVRMTLEYVKLVRFLAKELEDIKIIFRPHPIESIEGWKILIGEYTNVYVTKEKSISYWLDQSDILIHNGCTTGFESAIKNIDTISYQPIELKQNYYSSNKFGIKCSSSEDVLKTIRKKYTNIADDKKEFTKNKLEDYFVNAFSDIRASSRIVDEWKQLEKLLPNFSNFSIKKHIKISALKKNGFLLLKIFKRLAKEISSRVNKSPKESRLNIKKVQNFLSDYKFESLRMNEILEIKKDLTNINKDFDKVKIKKLSNRTFLFYK